MYTKENLKQQLHSMKLTGKETILIHSSMKAIGEVEGGADTVLDAWMEYFADGLLLLPTHTWANVNAECPVYDYRSTSSCVGLLTNLFRLREGVVRSLHPTHSLAGFGKGAAEYLAGEDENNTPCTPGGAYDRLRSVTTSLDHWMILCCRISPHFYFISFGISSPAHRMFSDCESLTTAPELPAVNS